MSTLQELFLITIAISFVGFNILYRPDAGTLFYWSLIGVLLLGVAAFVAHSVERIWIKIKSALAESNASPVRLAGGEKQKKLREQQQILYSKQSEEYEIKVAKREESKAQAKDDDFYRFSGPAWRGARQRLGGEVRKGTKNSGKNAAQIRRLPEQATKQHVVRPEEKPRPIKLELREEPAVDDDNVVTLSFRTEHRVHRRRFYTSDNIQLLLDYITTIGYHQKLYSLCTSYPRQCLSDDPAMSLAQLHITAPCVLNIEEKD